MKSLKLMIAMTLFSTSSAFGAVVHDESIDGDLSTNPASPTSLGALAVGESEVLGQTVRDAQGNVDRDFLTFTISPGTLLSEIQLNSYTASGDNTAFIGLYSGSFATTPLGANPTLAELLGGAHINASDLGDIFPEVESLFGSDKFDRPLGAGDYTILLQQTGPQLTQYGIGLVVTPEPASLALLALGGVSLLLRHRGYRRSSRRRR